MLQQIWHSFSEHCTKSHILFFQMFWKDYCSKQIALEHDLSCIIRKDGILPENMILFFTRKIKDDLSQKIHLCIFGKNDFFYLLIWHYPSFKKAKIIFSWKNTLKDDIFGIIEKDDIHPRKYGIFSDRKITGRKKVHLLRKVPMILCTL